MKFTTCDLFLVTVIVALTAGWWVDRSAMQRRLGVYRFNAEIHSGFIYEYERYEPGLQDAAGLASAKARPPLSASIPNPPSRDP
jgi:hypothetical protein